MRPLAIFLLMFAALPTVRPAMAADKATALIESVSHAASQAADWEAFGRLVTQESADAGGPRTEAAFRILIERVSNQRARIEITGVPAPLVRVCDGASQWGHLPATNQYWSIHYVRIDACAEPFDEWPYLAADLHAPVITGREDLNIGDRAVKCTVVSGDYSGPDATRSGRRVLWIDGVTKAIWQYRVERGTTGLASNAEPSVRIYTLLRQASGGVHNPSDFAVHHPEEWALLPRVPALRLGDGAPLSVNYHLDEQPGVYRVGNGVSAPVIISKDDPEYTPEARHKNLQGTVVLSVEVGPDGATHNIKIVHALGLGLDQKAVDAVSQWKFRPGMKAGVPVTVAATIEVDFRLMNDKKKSRKP
jgi:TonB family protein